MAAPKGSKNRTREISWEKLRGSNKKIVCERIGFIIDPTFPMLDCIYFFININGKSYSVINHPFQRLYRGRWKKRLLTECQAAEIIIYDILEKAFINK